jgi:hypothetical protein
LVVEVRAVIAQAPAAVAYAVVDIDALIDGLGSRDVDRRRAAGDALVVAGQPPCSR